MILCACVCVASFYKAKQRPNGLMPQETPKDMHTLNYAL